jgi:hypothetical protein
MGRPPLKLPPAASCIFALSTEELEESTVIQWLLLHGRKIAS